MNALSRILGLLGGRIDIGAITGIFERARSIVDRARALASKYAHDPELASLLSDAQKLLHLDSGEEITDAEIKALREHWGALNDQQVHDLPAAPSGPYAKVWPFDPRNDLAAASNYKGGDIVWSYPDGTFRVTDGKATIGGNMGDGVKVGVFSS